MGKRGKREFVLLYLGEKYDFWKRGGGKKNRYFDNMHPANDINISNNVRRDKDPYYYDQDPGSATGKNGSGYESGRNC